MSDTHTISIDLSPRWYESMPLSVVLAGIGMTAFELTKEWLFDDLTPWQSHIATILFCALTAGVIAYVVLRNNGRRHSRLLEAMTALRASEKKFRALADLLPEGAYETDVEGRVTYANKAATELFGYTQTDYTGGVTPLDLVASDDRERAKHNLQQELRGEPGGSARYTFLKKDGSTVPVLVHAGPIMDGDRCVGTRGLVVDLSERERAERELRDERERLTTLLSNTGDLVAAMDEDYTILFMSQKLVEQFGDRTGETCYQAFCGLEQPCGVNCAVDEVIKKSKDSFEYSHDGGVDVQAGRIKGEAAATTLARTRVLETVARPFVYKGERCVIEVSRDITARRRAEEAVLGERDKLLALLANVADGICAMDEEYNILFMGGEMVGEFGDLTGHKCYKAFCGWDKPCGINCAVDEIIKKGRERFAYTHTTKGDLRDGRIRADVVPHRLDWALETTARPFIYKGKRCVMEISRNVTERKHLEDQLRQVQKMEAVGQLAGGIAHDFNNILQAILGYTDMAKMGLSPEDQRSQDLEQVTKGANRAAMLTQQLLAFSRRQMIQPVDLNLNKMVTDLSQMLRRVIGEDVELDLELGADTAAVHADPGTLEQMLMNICVNARDAMPDGGRITIETEPIVLDGSFCQTHSWATPGDYSLLSVTDTGIGIAPEDQARIFEPFFTTKEIGKGTGLGLSMVYGLVKQHDGLIHCYSEEGKGTCFKIYLPSVERAAETSDESMGVSAPLGGKETVLLAEDEETVRELAVRVLERSGYRVLAAKDGEEALKLFEAHREDIEFALLDVVMPKVGGREVYDTIRNLAPGLPVLFSSGYSTSAVHAGFIAEAGLETIQKPYSPNTLLGKIRDVLDS